MTRTLPKPGDILAGKYQVEHVLGQGGMGIVVAARHLKLEQRVAIKWLLPEALGNEEIVRRFAREARAAARIRGEHVARVIDVGQFDDGSPFMVMEYLEGHDLAKLLHDRGQLPVEDVVRYLLETCEALAEAHAAKIVHRDLKPSNLFLTTRPDNRSIIKVLDFGISKSGDASTMALTSPTSIVGTAYYMSPEQMSAPMTVDHRADIWALGVVAYELLTGAPPFNGRSVPEVVAQILTNQPRSLREQRPDVPPELERVIAQCMQSKIADRYPDVADLAHALAPFAPLDDRSSSDTTARVLGKPRSIAPLGRALTDATTTQGVVASVAPPAPAVVAPVHAPPAPRLSAPWIAVVVTMFLGVGTAAWLFVGAPLLAARKAQAPTPTVEAPRSTPTLEAPTATLAAPTPTSVASVVASAPSSIPTPATAASVGSAKPPLAVHVPGPPPTVPSLAKSSSVVTDPKNPLKSMEPK